MDQADVGVPTKSPEPGASGMQKRRYDPFAGAKDVVERVAMALSMADPDERGLPHGVDMASFYRELARAAILAMRPTEEMLSAPGVEFASKKTWRAMIDAALSPSDDRPTPAKEPKQEFDEDCAEPLQDMGDHLECPKCGWCVAVTRPKRRALGKEE